VSYQQTFTLHTTERPTQEEQGESDSRNTLEPGRTIIHALSLTGNCIPECDYILPYYIYIYANTSQDRSLHCKISCLVLMCSAEPFIDFIRLKA